jgi:enoyl-CoA hydratase/carnithine racemase
MTSPSFDTIGYADEGAVAWITLDRPQVHNAMNRRCVQEVQQALHTAAGSNTVRVVVIQGRGGRAFTSGADITEIAGYGPKEMEEYNREWLKLFEAIEALPLPVVASIEGWATGGGTEMSLACDFVICAETARFGLAEINIGVIPGAGAAVRLTRWLGRLRAKELLMLGEVIDGRRAVEWHLANDCVPAPELPAATRRLAEKLASKPPLALAAAKRCVNIGAEAALSEGLEYELREFLRLFDTADQKEGMQAFLAKRRPAFVGR